MDFDRKNGHSKREQCHKEDIANSHRVDMECALEWTK